MVRATWVSGMRGLRVCARRRCSLCAWQKKREAARSAGRMSKIKMSACAPRGRDFLRKPKKKIRDGKNLVCAVLRL